MSRGKTLKLSSLRDDGAIVEVQEPPRRMLFGVDISNTRFVDRPVCLQAAAFAAHAHKGRYRKSGEPYVHHCVSTAVITEQMMLHLFSDDEWAIRRYIACACLHRHCSMLRSLYFSVKIREHVPLFEVRSRLMPSA
jgi:hypothetical protein